MTIPRSTQQADRSLTRDLLYAGRYYLGNRRGLLILAGLALVAGLALNWSWLVAAGIAPILISVLPCVAMCALGLCMNRAGGTSCSTAAEDSEPPAAADDAATITQATASEPLREPGAAETLTVGDIAPRLDPAMEPSKERNTNDA